MFKYLLTNVKHDNTYKNTPYFKNVEDRNKTLIGGDLTESLHNFNFGNILFTSVVVNTYNFENYFILKEENTDNYRFYFIVNSEYLSVNQWRLSLELDVITMYINGINENTISDCIINRGHCNRFIKELDNTYSFDVSEKSQIIQPEQTVNKVVSQRKKVKYRYSDDELINTWLNDNILCWCYAVVDVNHTYKDYMMSITGRETRENEITPQPHKIRDGLDVEYTLICVPIYKGENSIVLTYTDEIIIPETHETIKRLNSLDMEGLEWFLKLNDKYKYVYTVKLSNTPPIDFNDFSCSIVFSPLTETENLVIDTEVTIETITQNDFITSWLLKGCVGVPFNNSILGESIYNNTISGGVFFNVPKNDIFIDPVVFNQLKYNFTLEELKGAKNVKFEPKILLDCYDIVLSNATSGEYKINGLYNVSNQIQPIVDEPVTPTSTNSYYRIRPSIFGIIPEDTINDWSGTTDNINTSIDIVDDTYKSFLSNNKNFFLLKGLSQVPSMLGAVANPLSLVGLGTDILSTYSNLENIKNQKNNLLNTNDNMELVFDVQDGFNYFVSLYKARDIDIQRYFNYIYSHGYNVNIFDNVYKYIGTRKYFNYVQCEIEKININVPDNVENKIKDIFKQGIRLWNTYENMYNYTMENYEIYLDN